MLALNTSQEASQDPANINDYVKQKIAEWEAENPKPEHLHSAGRPEVPEATVSRHRNGYLILMADDMVLKAHVTAQNTNMDIFLNTAQLSDLIEQLLSLEAYLQEFYEFKNGNAALTAWTTERGNLMNYWRKEFVAQNEHRGVIAQEE